MAAVIGSLRADLSASIAQFQSDMGKAAASMERFARRARTVSRDIGRVGQDLTLGLTAPIVAFAIAAGKAAAEVRDAAGQVTAALASMGNRSGKSLKDLQKQAEDLRDSSLFDDDDILRNVTANMLTFGNVSGEIFDRAQQAVVDLATRMDGDLQGATIRIGKALQDPIKGATALSKQGVILDDTQKALIKSFVKSGQGAKAQAIILDELAREYKGAGQAAQDASPTDKMMDAWNQLKEVVGAIVLEYLPPLVNFLSMLADRFEALPEPIQRAVVVIGGLIALLGPLALLTSTMLKVGIVFADVFSAGGILAGAGQAMAALGMAVGGLMGALLPLLAVLAAVVALVWRFRQVIVDAAAGVLAAIQGALGQEVPALLAAFGQLWSDLTSGPIGEFFTVVGYLLAQFLALLTTAFGDVAVQVITALIRVFTAFVKTVGDLVRLVNAILRGDWKGAWEAAQQAVQDSVGGMLHAADAIQPGIEAWAQAIWSTIKQWVVDGVSSLLDAINARFPGLVTAMAAAAQGAIAWAKSLWQGIKTWINDNLGPVIQWAMDRLAQLAAFFGQVSAKANAAIANPVAVPTAPAAPKSKAMPPIIAPSFSTGGGGGGAAKKAESEAKKIQAATARFAESIRDLNDQVAKGLDERELPKSVAAAEGLRRKIADITEDAQRSGVAVSNFAGQIGALKAQIEALETQGLSGEAEKFADEVARSGREVREFSGGGLDPLAERLQEVDDRFGALRESILATIEANAVLAEKNADAAASMKLLQGQLDSLGAAHDKATEAARSQYDAENLIADLQAKSEAARTRNDIADLKQARGDAGPVMTKQQERIQSIERELEQDRIDSAIKLATMQASYDDAQRVGDEDAMLRLQGLIGLQTQYGTLLEETTAAQLEAQARIKDAWQTFQESLTDKLTDMVADWKFDLDGIRNIFKDLAKELFLKPFISSATAGFSSFLQGFSGFHADGGTIKRGQWGIAGENGPEPIFAKTAALHVVPNDQVGVGGGGGSRAVQQVFNISTPDANSFRRSQRQIARVAKQKLAV